jgi:hypothetical protein
MSFIFIGLFRLILLFGERRVWSPSGKPPWTNETARAEIDW